MFDLNPKEAQSSVERPAAGAYWPAPAAAALAAGKYSRAVELCREGLAEEPGAVAGRLIYARALYHAGQVESAAEQFYEVLARDPENAAALKYLGDIKWAEGDVHGAVAHWRRVLEIDPYCRELRCDWRARERAADEPGSPASGEDQTASPSNAGAGEQLRTAAAGNGPAGEGRATGTGAPLRTITLKRDGEQAAAPAERARLREVPFYTETVGDLYLAQGHYR
ncbi:MAG TPA: tetratricopeptide repeat protein, partial [candidate division Zixibacteria bacterium]|nr:tetratricopeptide repeat protein [candidate division Zixibacteria bacterium]